MSIIELNKNKKIRAAVIFPDVIASRLNVSAEARLEEACGLALAINLDVVYQEIIKIRELRPSAFFGRGVIDRLLPLIAELEIDLLIVDNNLTPIQQRSLEKSLKIKVIDRTALILEIFGDRAQTKEGRLQVELAHLTYQRSRLVRSWTHLERQRGGAGFLGGPGETQIELDRRLIDDKIVRIKKDLEKVRQTRTLQRGARKRVPYPVVALVGYTNAGKSSLFNKLSGAEAFTQDLLFATLDPAMRKVSLPSGKEVILSDTVGFISDLPHELIMSFRATLEEVLEADVVVHVRDIANPNTKEQKQDVLSVLSSLGFNDIEQKNNYIEVFNKIDLLEPASKAQIIEQAAKNSGLCALSAITGEGTERFLQMVDDKISESHAIITLQIPASDGRIIAWIHEHADVISSTLEDDDFMKMQIKIDETSLAKLNLMLKI